MKKLGLIVVLLVSCCVLSAQTLAQRLDSFVSSADLLKTSEVGITVFNLTQGESVFCYQDEKLYRPASIEKVITAVTALAKLGNDYTFDTRLCYTGTIGADSILRGDLFVIGGFDPEFMDDDLVRLAEAVKYAGIRQIEGNLVADVSLTDSIYWGMGWSWDDTPEAFQPYLSPLMLNRGCVDVTVVPSQKGMHPQVEVHPHSSFYSVDNQARSYVGRAGKLKITRDWLRNENTIRISGNVSHRQVKKLNLYNSAGFFISTFVEHLSEQGINVKTITQGVCPSEAIELYKYSRSLEPVLKRALKKSDNLAAEALFYHLGACTSEEKLVGYRDAQRAVYCFMREQLGRTPGNYKIVDGSGVSLYNYISPDLLLDYLKYAYAHPSVFSVLYDALPIAGVDGTLAGRMKYGKAYRNVHAKTGTVTGVSSLAGYVKNGKNEMLAFVIINQNVLNGKEARMFQNKICEILAQ